MKKFILFVLGVVLIALIGVVIVYSDEIGSFLCEAVGNYIQSLFEGK